MIDIVNSDPDGDYKLGLNMFSDLNPDDVV